MNFFSSFKKRPKHDEIEILKNAISLLIENARLASESQKTIIKTIKSLVDRMAILEMFVGEGRK